MTSHLIARVVENLYNKIDIDEMLAEFNNIEKWRFGRISDEFTNKNIENKEFNRWLLASYKLEEHLRCNFSSFVETELVRKWAGDICAKRNELSNRYRSEVLFSNLDFHNWLKKQGIISASGRF